MSNVIKILSVLILSGIISAAGAPNHAFAQESENSLIQDVINTERNFDNLLKSRPDLGLTEADRAWYTGNYKSRDSFEANPTKENIQKIREEANSANKKPLEISGQLQKSQKQKDLEQVNEQIQALEEKKESGTLSDEERQQLNSLYLTSDMIAKRIGLLQFNKGETIDMVANKKGGGDNSVDICSKNCSPYCYYKDLDRCTFCRLFETFFNTASSMAKKAMNTFAGSVVQVVIIAFAIWLAVLVLGFISSVETRDVKDLVSSILQQSFMVALVIILLQTGGASFFNLVLTPIYNTGMKIAQTALSPDLSKVKTDGKTLIVTQRDNSKQKIALLNSKIAAATKEGERKTPLKEDLEMESYKVICDKGNIYGLDKGALPQEMGESILCTMTMIQNQASKIKALGSSAICYSWQKRVLIFPHLSYLLTGIGLWIGGMILIIAVPFLMIDAVLELAVAAALLPAAIGAYAFKITRRYSKPVWDTFLNSMFVFMFVSLIALMLTTAFEMVLIDTTKGSLDELIFANTDAMSFEKMLKDISWFSLAFLKICFALILTWTVMGEAKDFAGQFSGSISNTAIGSQIGTMAGSFTKSAVKKASSPLAEAAGNHLWRGGGNLLRSPFHAINRARMNRRNNRVVKQGTKIGEDTYKLGNRTVRIDQNGNKTLLSTKDKTVRSGWGKKLGTVTSTKIQSKHFSVETQSGVLDDGTTYQRDIIKLNSNAIRKLYNRRGQVNQDVYDELLESCGTDKKLKIALMKEITHHRMPNMKHKINDHAFSSQELIEENGQVVGYIERLPDGSKVEVRISTNEKGRMMTEITQTSAKGVGTRLATDGLLNIKSTFLTQDGTADGAMDKDTLRDRISAAAYYNDIRTTGRFHREIEEEGMFGWDRDTAWRYFRKNNDTISEFRSTTF